MVESNRTGAKPDSGSSAVRDSTDAISIELRKAREAKGLTFSDLHRLTGLSRTALHQYESGKTKPGAREILKLCEILEISPNRLLTGSEDPFIGSSGVLLALVAMARTEPQKAAVLSALLVPLMASILSSIGNETLIALATIADETIRARDPESFSHLAKMVSEIGAVDSHAVSKMSPDERKQASIDLTRKVGPPPNSAVTPEQFEASVNQEADRLRENLDKLEPSLRSKLGLK